MKHDQWKEDMHDGVDMAHKSQTPTAVTVTEATRLHKSINAPTNLERMKDDTVFRTGGVVGANKAERINGIAESFAKLNCGRDGG